MTSKIFFTLDIEKPMSDSDTLIEDLEKIPEIEKADIEADAMGIETIVISIVAPLIAELLKKYVLPVAINKLKKLIRLIFKRKKDSSLDSRQTPLKLKYGVLILEFNSENDEDIDKKLRKLKKYIEN